MHLIYWSKMLTGFNRTEFSFQEVYTITKQFADGTVVIETELGITHFYNRIYI